MNIFHSNTTVSHVVLGLKTTKGTKQLKLDPTVYESLQREKVSVGDVIYIESNTGTVKVCFCVCVRVCLCRTSTHSVPCCLIMN